MKRTFGTAPALSPAARRAKELPLPPSASRTATVAHAPRGKRWHVLTAITASLFGVYALHQWWISSLPRKPAASILICGLIALWIAVHHVAKAFGWTPRGNSSGGGDGGGGDSGFWTGGPDCGGGGDSGGGDGGGGGGD